MTPSHRRGLTVLCDFDDTAAACNAAQILLSRFGGPGAAGVQAEYRNGTISFREYQEKMFGTVSAPVSELVAYVRQHVSLRPGVTDAVKATRDRGGRFVIVSAGIDFYIAPVLAAHGLEDVPILSVTGSPAGEDAATMTFRYDYPRGNDRCRDWAVCKCEPIDEAKARDEHVIFIGDGLRSDSCAAEKAHTVFARSRLLDHCRIKGIDAMPFDDFFPIARFIAGMEPDSGRAPGDAAGVQSTKAPE